MGIGRGFSRFTRNFLIALLHRGDGSERGGGGGGGGGGDTLCRFNRCQH